VKNGSRRNSNRLKILDSGLRRNGDIDKFLMVNEIFTTTEPVYFSSAYGLGIRSCIPLPEYVARHAGSDVVIRKGNDISLPKEVAGRNWYFDVTIRKALLYFKGIGIFHLKEGREVFFVQAHGVDRDLFRLYLIGSVMSVLLYQRGMVVLHAGAVEMSGAGKSSTVAALYNQGHGIISDDVTVVDPGESSFKVLPGSPQVKIGPEVAETLGYEKESLFLINPLEKEYGLRATRGFPESELDLKCIYVLSEGQELKIEQMRPRDAVIELVRHSMPTRLLQQPAGESHFLKCVALARQAPVYRLQRSRSLLNLVRETRMIGEHFGRLEGER
jgi:hypothetical protein